MNMQTKGIGDLKSLTKSGSKKHIYHVKTKAYWPANHDFTRVFIKAIFSGDEIKQLNVGITV